MKMMTDLAKLMQTWEQQLLIPTNFIINKVNKALFVQPVINFKKQINDRNAIYRLRISKPS
jgi:hypothetical protein